MFGERLKKIRKHFNFTQEQMACELDFPVRTYASYEREENNPPYSMLLLLLEKYDVNLNWFISGNGKMFNAPKYEDVENSVESVVLEILKEKGVI